MTTTREILKLSLVDLRAKDCIENYKKNQNPTEDELTAFKRDISLPSHRSALEDGAEKDLEDFEKSIKLTVLNKRKNLFDSLTAKSLCLSVGYAPIPLMYILFSLSPSLDPLVKPMALYGWGCSILASIFYLGKEYLKSDK